MEQNKKLHHEISIVEQTSKELEIQFTTETSAQQLNIHRSLFSKQSNQK